MHFTLLSAAILLIFATAASIEVLRGARRGFLKTLLSLGNIILSLIYSLIVSPSLSENFTSVILDAFDGNHFLSSLDRTYECFDLIANAVASMIVSSIIFIAVFLLTRAFIGIIFAIVYQNVLKPDGDSTEYANENDPWHKKSSKLWGAITGFVCGAIITAILTAPIMGSLDVIDGIIDIAETVDENVLANDESGLADFEEYSHDIPGNVFYQLGGKYIYIAATTKSINGEPTSLLQEVGALKTVLSDTVRALPGIESPERATSEHLYFIKHLSESYKDLVLLDPLVAEFINISADGWLDGKTVLGIPKPSFNEFIDPAFNSILTVCTTTNAYTVESDIETILGIYSIIIESGALHRMSSSELLTDFLTNSDFIDRLLAELEKNPHMASAKSAVGDIALHTLANQIDRNKDPRAYDELMENIADAINSINERNYGTREEKLEAMQEYASRYIEEYGISLPENLTSVASELILERLSDGGSVTPENVISFFESYMSN